MADSPTRHTHHERSAHLVWRTLHANEIDHERVWSLVFILGVGLALAVPEAWRMQLGCPIKTVLGVPCLSCGTNRAISALLHIDPYAAFGFNPLVTAACFSAALYIVYAAIVVFGRLPRLRPAGNWRSMRPLLAGVVLVGVVANWLYLFAAGI